VLWTLFSAIVVHADCRDFAGSNGVLFNKSLTKLIQYPIGSTNSSYDIPAGVTRVGNSAFQDCNSLSNVTIIGGNGQGEIPSLPSGAYQMRLGAPGYAPLMLPAVNTSISRRIDAAAAAAGAAIAAGTGAKVPIGWLITFHLLNSIGFANVFPVSLALYARVAPAALSATIIGIYYLAFFAANNLVGWIGGFLEKMPATNFWLLHSALCGTAGIIFFVAGRSFGHLLAPGDQESPGNA
jgi:hypothetical protein